jgi:hypothetical protein
MSCATYIFPAIDRFFIKNLSLRYLGRSNTLYRGVSKKRLPWEVFFTKGPEVFSAMYFTLSDLIIDITQNAVESEASQVELEVQETEREFRFSLKDNGRGMNQHELERAIDPFLSDGQKHPHRKVGLGIPFLIQTTLQSGGSYDLHSEKNAGTTITAWFDLTMVDTPPVGDISGMFRTVMLFAGPEEICIHRSRQTGEGELSYKISKSELRDVLGDLEDTASLILLDRYLKSMEENGEE